MRDLFLKTTAVFVVVVSLVGVGSRPESTSWRTMQYENVLGTSMELKLRAASEADADRAEAAALSEIQRLNSILSGYDRASEFRCWAATRGQAVPVSPELMQVLQLWDTWRERSHGALSPSAEAISRIWKQAERASRMPERVELASAAAIASQPQWSLEPGRSLATRLSDAPVMLNSFTKSYIVERAAEAAMRTPGVAGVVVNIGGDLVVRGPDGDSVQVANPFSDSENSAPISVLRVKDRAVATSGNYRRGFEINGQHYSHIVDPRTGNTAEQVASATVVAPKAVDAGALATALCVLSPSESRQLASSVPGVEYLLVRKDGSRVSSKGWSALEAKPKPQMMAWAAAPAKPVAAAAAAADTGLWNPAYELTVQVEIPQVQGFGVRRPYVAVWVEDKDRFPVRTLALWFNNTRWLPDLRAWYRGDRLRAMSEGTEILNSVTSATRSPGKYTFKWDGKDNSGKPVKAGRYTILVEAAREHGGYNLVRHTIEVNGAVTQAQLPAEGELGAVSIDYRKAAR